MMQDNAAHAVEPTYPPNPPRKADVSALREQVRRLAPALDPATPAFQAALLLLSALRVGQNIDRLARITRCERSFVAKCARRLVDNGVWQNGKTVCDWYRDGEARSAFWNDVAVAEGRMCRRVNGDGETEWAEAGVWRKSYDFVSPRPHTEPANLYHTPPPAELEPTPLFDYAADETDRADDGTPEAGGEAASNRKLRRRKRLARDGRRFRGSWIAASTRPRQRFHRAAVEPGPARPPLPNLPSSLFPDAQWIG